MRASFPQLDLQVCGLILRLCGCLVVGFGPWNASAADLPRFSIGEPTDEEQKYVELINRARANPEAEASRLRSVEDPEIRNAYQLFSVDLDLMEADISSLPPAQPLSIHPLLLEAARLHSLDMLEHSFQGHAGSDGRLPHQRLTGLGYNWNLYGENVFAHGRSVEHGHAGFEVDWGDTDTIGGMQNPPGHRLSIHHPDFQEIGVGVRHSARAGIGPQVVTQNFGRQPGLRPIVTGVAYFDLNGNGFYDIGEGLGEVIVTVERASFEARTVRSGGYSVPLPANGSYQVTFTAPHLVPSVRSIEVAGGRNTKLDLAVEYIPPVLKGPDELRVKTAYPLPIVPTPGVARYQVLVAKSIPAPTVEGAEAPMPPVQIESSSGYDVIQSQVKASGSRAFHLAHPISARQQLRLNRLFHPNTVSELIFQSRLGWASENQQAQVEVSVDGGIVWQTVWARAGTGDGGQLAFGLEQVSLGAYAGKPVTIQFTYTAKPGLYFNQSSAGVGWYFDDLQFIQTDELIALITHQVPANLFVFTPAEEGDYALFAQPEAAGRLFPSGAGLKVRASTNAPEPALLRITGVNHHPGGEIELLVSVQGAELAAVGVESSSDPTGPWIVETGAHALPAGEGIGRILTSAGGAGQRFYRLVLP